MVAVQCIKCCRYRSGVSVNVHIKHQNGEKCDLSDFDCGMIVGAIRVGLRISEKNNSLRMELKPKSSSVQQLCGKKHLVDERHQRRMDRLVGADRKSMVTQITTLYNCGEQKSINRSNLEVAGLQQQKTMSGSTPVSQEQKPEASVGSDTPTLDRIKTGKM